MGLSRFDALPVFVFLSAVILAGCRQSPEVVQEGSKVPLQVLLGVRSRSLDGDRVLWALDADRAWFTLSDEARRDASYDFDRPVISFYEEGRLSSVIHAERGRVDSLTGEARAWDGTVIRSTEGARLETAWLVYSSSSQVVTTTAPVILTRGNSVTSGVGMEATPDLNRVEIYQQKTGLVP